MPYSRPPGLRFNTAFGNMASLTRLLTRSGRPRWIDMTYALAMLLAIAGGLCPAAARHGPKRVATYVVLYRRHSRDRIVLCHSESQGNACRFSARPICILCGHDNLGRYLPCPALHGQQARNKSLRSESKRGRRSKLRTASAAHRRRNSTIKNGRSCLRPHSTTGVYSRNEWITTPERSFGSNHVVFGGTTLPVSAMLMSCCIETG